MNAETRAWMLSSYEKDFRAANPDTHEQTVQFYLDRYAEAIGPVSKEA